MFRNDDPYRPRLEHWVIAAVICIASSIVMVAR